MTEYRVDLEAYSGPLDLLLYLVRRHEIDLHDIPVARLTDQYLAHLEQMRQLDIDLAGEFLVMASMLLEVKSAMLMPQAVAVGAEEGDAIDDGEPLDPRYELVQTLLAYKRFKDAANALDSRRLSWEQRYPQLPSKDKRERPADEEPELVELDLDDVSVQDLCDAFARMLESVGRGPAQHEVTYDDTPISVHAEDILDRLDREGPLTLESMMEGRRSRDEMIGVFLATLELIRQRQVRVAQEPGQPIQVIRRPEEERAQPTDEPVDWRNPETGQIEYEWASEADRRRAERRAKLRATYAERRKTKGAASPSGDDEDIDETIDEEFDEDGEPDELEDLDDLDEDSGDEMEHMPDSDDEELTAG